jgi:nicotinate-nucleotide--dimethylbenzimidazole phosphoribosyltransferase
MDVLAKYEAVIFDVGNTLLLQNNPGLSSEELKIEILPGVVDLLNTLKNKKRLAVVSNSKLLNSSEILEKLNEVGLGYFFELCISSLDIGEEKPSPLPLITALHKMNLSPDKAIYVGDVETDKQAAELAGMDFLFTSTNILEAFTHFNIDSKSAWIRALLANIDNNLGAAEITQKRINELIKPIGSLGKLESLAVKISAITGEDPKVDPAAVCVFVADHGVAKDESVTPWPQKITSLMSDVISDGKAGISSIAQSSDVYIEVVNVGTVEKPKSTTVKNYPIAQGTKDFRIQPAMSSDQLIAALEIGAQSAERLVAGGSRALCTGEVGIGNTTSAAILIATFCSAESNQVTGYGSGIPEDIFQSKLNIVTSVLNQSKLLSDPLEILAKYGGFEIAALVGFIIRAATLKVPIILDGVITLAAAVAANKIRPGITSNLIAGHCSAEPASAIAIKYLQLDPILDLDLRLGEGTGAVLAIPIIRAACNITKSMGELKDYL